MNSDIWALPFEIQLVLASGYAAYFLSYVGIREHHKSVEIIFIVFAYGIITKLCFGILQTILPTLFNDYSLVGLFINKNTAIVWSTIFAFATTLFVGYIWRRLGREYVRSQLRKSDYTWSNDDPTSWRTITSSTEFWFSQASVQLIDGTWLECKNAKEFVGEPHGPMTLGQNGDIALYVTDITAPNRRKSTTVLHIKDSNWGSRITYIPSNQIKRLTFRLQKKS
jgi:hypothetical protein